MEEAFYNISMYFYNKNVLEYDQIARSGHKPIIRDIEGFSTLYSISHIVYVKISAMKIRVFGIALQNCSIGNF